MKPAIVRRRCHVLEWTEMTVGLQALVELQIPFNLARSFVR